MNTRRSRGHRENEDIPARDAESRARTATAILGAGIVLAIVVGTALSLLFDDPLYIGIGLAGIGGGAGVIASVMYAGDDRSGPR